MNIKGKVVFEKIGMGFWGIISEKGKKFRPVEMPKTLQKEGLSIEADIEILDGEVSMFMWGEAISLKSFKVLH